LSNIESNKSLKVLHFSDIHVGMQIRHMNWKKWFSKRAIGAINLLRGRAKYFDEAEEKIAAIVRLKEEHNIDLVINTGDYTALGLELELELAKSFVEPLMSPPQSYVTVPGNHDIYVHEGNSHYRFSEQFCSVLQNDLPEYCRGGHWPLVRLVGDDVAVVAVNSSRPNPWPWRSNGEIPKEQLEALSEIFVDERVKERFIFVITHYAPRLDNGKPDKKLHGLINADEFLDRCRVLKKGAILFGHIHKAYNINVEGLNVPLICSGSATMEGKEGLWIYEVKDKVLTTKQMKWNIDRYIPVY